MPKLHNRHHKNVPSTAVYIGRGTPWGNQFIIGRDGTREECVYQYQLWVESQPHFQRRVQRELKGKDLVCSCVPALCHGVILLAVANK